MEKISLKGVIEEAVPWARSREFFFYTVKRRIAQDDIISKLKAADDTLTTDAATDIVKGMCSADWENNQAVIDFFAASSSDIDAKIDSVRKAAIEAKIAALQAAL